ncbi:MAG: hypothetical protein ACTSUE_02600 [Promethearchaeota archaeon]
MTGDAGNERQPVSRPTRCDITLHSGAMPFRPFAVKECRVQAHPQHESTCPSWKGNRFKMNDVSDRWNWPRPPGRGFSGLTGRAFERPDGSRLVTCQDDTTPPTRPPR